MNRGEVKHLGYYVLALDAGTSQRIFDNLYFSG